MSRKSRQAAAAQSVTVATPVVETQLDTLPVPEAPVAPAAETPEAPAAEVPPAEVPEAAAPATDTPPVSESDAAFGPVVHAASDTPAAPKGKKKYPREGGKCWQVWNFCDTHLAANGNVSVADARAHAVANNWNVSNASQEFYAWRKYHGRV